MDEKTKTGTPEPIEGTAVITHMDVTYPMNPKTYKRTDGMKDKRKEEEGNK